MQIELSVVHKRLTWWRAFLRLVGCEPRHRPERPTPPGPWSPRPDFFKPVPVVLEPSWIYRDPTTGLTVFTIPQTSFSHRCSHCRRVDYRHNPA